MKTIQVSVFYFILIALTVSCKNSKDYQPVESTAETVIITGNVSNSISNMNTVTVYVRDIVTGDPLTYVSLLDSTGNFRIQYKQYLPQDVLLRYGDGTFFPVLVHPKDSINVNFDARLIDKKMELAKTIRFSGSASELNSKLIVFSSQILQIGIPWEKYCQYEKEYSAGKFVKLLDSLKSVRENVMNRFIKEYNPSEELKIWIKYDVEMDYINSLARYPNEFAELNNRDEFLVVPLSFYDFMNISLPYDALINSKSIDFIGRYNFARVRALMVEHGDLYKLGTIWAYKSNSSRKEIKTICKYTKDSLLQEMLISKRLYDLLDRREIKDFEKNLSVFEGKVHKPFLREPIINKYVATKRNLE